VPNACATAKYSRACYYLLDLYPRCFYPPRIVHIQTQIIYYNGYVDCNQKGCTELTGAGLTPVHFFSHGSTMMLGEESTSGDYWKKCGDEALAHDIKGVIMMVSFAFT
jgi:hypothetical protein